MVFLPAIPKNATGKIQKREVKEILAREPRPGSGGEPTIDREERRNMDRREFLKTAMAVPLAAATGAPAIAAGKRKDKPNLLFLWADQQRPDTMRVYGNAKIRAPNFNRLADECSCLPEPLLDANRCALPRARR